MEVPNARPAGPEPMTRTSMGEVGVVCGVGIAILVKCYSFLLVNVDN